MKFSRRMLLVLLPLVFSGAAVLEAQQRHSMDLNSGWEFRQLAPDATAPTQWYPARVPGDVHLDLIENKLIPDPFYRDNEAKLQWIENADWEYRTTLQVSSETLSHQHVELVFEGLDSAADIYVNDQLALHADNAFREWRLDVKTQLKPGANQLRIVFPSPIKAAAKVAEKDPWRSRTGTDAKTYIRKPAYEYGWDWGPRFVTSGIWRPAHLETWDAARIDNVYIHQLDISAKQARLNVETDVIASQDAQAKLTVNYGRGGKEKNASQNIFLRAGVNHLTLPIEIENPDLWYPAGYGAQPIYPFHVQINQGKAIADEASARAGLRSLVLRRDVDQWGRSFEFVVNGIPVYAKGADVIPFDSFPSRVTTAQYRSVLESARDANMNMIRHWGGGYYETQEFYDICDELGIMVWQDFMFGNDWQPGTYDFKQQVEKEVRYQIQRLRNHPSIVIWSGNNETEAAFHWAGRDKLSEEVRLRMWEDYLTVFSGIIARSVAELNPETPYWPSSPSSDYEDTTPEYQSGDMHEWNVWHGRVDFEEYETHFPRFMTEYGFQSFPEMRTIEAFTRPEDRTSIFTPVMLAHQKNNEGNSIIHDYMLRYYGEPKDFASFLYASQVLQAEGIKIGAEHLRRIRPRNMGGIYWQLNDCWPVASWSSLDYYGRWKALQYYAKRFYAPLLVSPHVEDGKLAVYVISDKTAPVNAHLRLRIMDLQGKVLRQEQEDLTISAGSSKSYLQIPLSEFVNANGTDAAAIFGAADLEVDGKPVSSNIVYFVPTKMVHLPEPNIVADLAQQGNAYQLKLSSPALARSVYVSFGELDAKFSDNYVDLLPGEPIEITVTSPAALDQLKASLKIMSLAGAFAPPLQTAEPAK
ncbi:glycoside hydrolase family 2 protein [Alloacidobacterium dinghuense]|uniref:Beta-mannosidase n=1 Tax=Alloacidobacterium dinghuense TaxID=2763107 RepID=A0A7G8BNE1_9BACT|nr:glycoside hydrolase family 2 protein [Alloacidobacterium dinghuense]QNI34061.1 glycoside hydrolase family 2 protein [Alloacidobacterium dinghuense]